MGKSCPSWQMPFQFWQTYFPSASLSFSAHWHEGSAGFLGASITVYPWFYSSCETALWNCPISLFPTFYPSGTNNNAGSEHWTATQAPPFEHSALLPLGSLHQPILQPLLWAFWQLIVSQDWKLPMGTPARKTDQQRQLDGDGLDLVDAGSNFVSCVSHTILKWTVRMLEGQNERGSVARMDGFMEH